VYGDGGAVRDYLFVDDFVSVVGALAGADTSFDTMNVGSGVGATVNDVIAAVEQCAGRPLDLEYLPARSCDVRQIVLDTSRVQEAAPFEPRGLADGIGATWSSSIPELCPVVL
jgi:UDP-glucose 4-epimerase